jgi:hypothetical protein
MSKGLEADEEEAEEDEADGDELILFDELLLLNRLLPPCC